MTKDTHRCRKVQNIGVEGGGARFRILGGGGQGGPNSQQAHDVVTTSMRRNDVASTFLILKYDIIENSRIELRGIVLPVHFKSN